MQFGISEAVRHWGRYRPEAEAVLCNGDTVTYATLNREVAYVSGNLALLGLPGIRIATLLTSKYRLLVTVLGILRAGQSAVILHAGLPGETLAVNLRDSRAQFLIGDRPAEDLCASLQRETGCQVLYENELCKAPVFGNLAQREPRLGPADEWAVLFSSGTTGMPKGIARNHHSMVTELLGWCLELALSRGTSFYIGRPIYYTGGLVLALSTLMTCGTIVLNDTRDDVDHLSVWNDYEALLASRRIDWAFFVPDQLRAFLRIAKAAPLPVRAAETILVMGAPISGHEKQELVRVLGSRLVESWGNSESLGTITDPEDISRRPDSIGRPFLTDEMYILDDNGLEVGAGVLGRIAGGEEAGFDEYCNRPEETARVRREGLIISEDIGFADEAGFFYVRGREQQQVLIDGQSIFLPQVESEIRIIPGVVDCCVVVLEGSLGSPALAAAIVLDTKGTTENPHSLVDGLRRRFGLSRATVVDSMPRLPSGKVDRLKVDEMIRGVPNEPQLE